MLDKYHEALKNFDQIVNSFKWEIPHSYNIASAICDRHSGKNKLAMIYEDLDGSEKKFSFDIFKRYSDNLAAYLNKLGISKGDRIGVFLEQSPEAAISHLAIFKLGAISVPLSIMFGQESILHRLRDCNAKVVIANQQTKKTLNKIKTDLESLEYVFVTSDPEGEEINFQDAISITASNFRLEKTLSTDPALIIYTSGTTGLPKGALHAHQCIPSRFPGFQLAHDFFPKQNDLYWSPADWAWIGGLLDSLFTPWAFSVPVVVQQRKKFDPEKAFHFLSKYRVKNAFIPPTALKIMANVPNAKNSFSLQMRSVHSGGEALPTDIIEWGKELFGSVTEMYGMTEMGFIVGNCPSLMKIKTGSMGKPYPGHPVVLIDFDGNPVPIGEQGEVAIHKSDPGMFLGYWDNPEGTRGKFNGDWFLSNDLAVQDSEGYLWFQGRTDDVIISSGYRIGPTEIEKCIFNHPSVTDVAVIGSPDPIRGEVVKAFIKLNQLTKPSEKIKTEIQILVKERLAAHEYPREIEFIEDFPKTSTGKIKRSELREQEKIKKKSINPTINV